MLARWLWTLLAFTGSALAVEAEPFDFRSVALGTTLEDLRRVRFQEAPGARIVCAHDEAARDLRPTRNFFVTDEQAVAGVKICGVFNFGKILGPSSSSLPAEWISARLKIGNVDVIPVFWFVPGRPPLQAHPQPQSEASAAESLKFQDRLFKIVMRTNATYWEDVLASFTRRYGKPASTDRGTFPGTRLENQTVVWSNPESTIKLIKRSETSQRTLIVYEHKDLTIGSAQLANPHPATFAEGRTGLHRIRYRGRTGLALRGRIHLSSGPAPTVNSHSRR